MGALRAVCRMAVWLCIVFVCIAGIGAPQPAAAQDTPPVLIAPDASHLAWIFERINELRAARGLPPYVVNPALNAAAQSQAEWLITTRRRTHFRPDGSGPRARAEQAGFFTSHWCCGENYYMSIDATPQMVTDFWRWSPGHAINVYHRDFTDIGLGMSGDGYRISYVTLFGQIDTAPAVMVSDVSAPAPPAPDAVSAPEAAPAEAPPPGIATTYVVQYGDTLARIAARFGVGWADLLRVNDIPNPDLIYEGQVIHIPGP